MPQSPPALCFVVGMSRAGTSWMARCLNAHSAIVAIGETEYWGRGYVTPDAAGWYGDEQLEVLRRRYTGRSGRTRILFGEAGFLGSGAGTYRTITDESYEQVLEQAFGEASRIQPGEQFRRIAAAVAAAEGAAVVAEKTPHHLNWTDRILGDIPEARFIVMTREPYGFMRSYKYYGATTDGGFRNDRYHPAACAMVWRGYHRAATALLAALPDRCVHVDYDRIAREPAALLAEVQRFIGVPVEELALDAVNSSFGAGPLPELEPADVFWMNLVCGRDMAAAALPRRRSGAGPVRVGRSTVALLPWALDAARLLRRTTEGSSLRYVRRWLGGR